MVWKLSNRCKQIGIHEKEWRLADTRSKMHLDSKRDIIFSQHLRNYGKHSLVATTNWLSFGISNKYIYSNVVWKLQNVPEV